MAAPVVTRQHLERAWLEATGAASVLQPGKWNQELVRRFVAEVPTIASVMLAASAKRFRSKERASIAQWIAAWLYRGYQLAGAHFAPLTKVELLNLLSAEQSHLVKISKLGNDQMVIAEAKRMLELPNGRLLEMLMQVWGRACQQLPKQGEDPILTVQDTYFARLHLAVVLAALSLSAERAQSDSAEN